MEGTLEGCPEGQNDGLGVGAVGFWVGLAVGLVGLVVG